MCSSNLVDKFLILVSSLFVKLKISKFSIYCFLFVNDSKKKGSCVLSPFSIAALSSKSNDIFLNNCEATTYASFQ
ncbi:Uncharacterised protein [Chlamydia abortus]|nr:Uncharacterised protein [Chlamydia abortus]